MADILGTGAFLCPASGGLFGCSIRQGHAFQHVAQRVLALDGHPSGGAGSDSDDWLKDSHNPSPITRRRLSAGLLGRGRLRSDYRRSQRVFLFLLQFDRTRRCLRAVLTWSASGETAGLRQHGTPRTWIVALPHLLLIRGGSEGSLRIQRCYCFARPSEGARCSSLGVGAGWVVVGWVVCALRARARRVPASE